MGRPINGQETTITWLRCDEYASIYTSDSTMINRFDKFVSGGDWELVKEERVLGEVVAKWYKAPKSLLFGRPKKMKRDMSEEQKEALSARMKSLREAQVIQNGA